MYLNEGGNAIKTSAPIRGDIAKIIADSIVNKIQDILNIKACPLGSTGKKSANQMSGDIDIAVELQWNDDNIQKVKDFIKASYGDKIEVVASPGLRLISMGFPYKFSGNQNIVQVDLMFTTDINYSKFMYHSPDFIKNESLFKGLYRTNLLIIIAGKTPLVNNDNYKIEYFGDEFGPEYEGTVKSFWKYSLSYEEGLKIVHKSFEGKRKPLKAPKTIKEDTIIVSKDLSTILKMCLGEKATIANCNSFETLVDFVCSPNYIHRSKKRLDTIFEEFFDDPRHNKDEEILQMLHHIVDDAYERYGVNQLNESKWDFRHIDPATGMPKMMQHRKEDDIKLINQHPMRTGWIILLQNRVNLNSVGNMRYKKKVWYDRQTHTVSTDKTMSDPVVLTSYVLPNARKPAGWLYANELNEDGKYYNVEYEAHVLSRYIKRQLEQNRKNINTIINTGVAKGCAYALANFYVQGPVDNTFSQEAANLIINDLKKKGYFVWSEYKDGRTPILYYSITGIDKRPYGMYGKCTKE